MTVNWTIRKDGDRWLLEGSDGRLWGTFTVYTDAVEQMKLLSRAKFHDGLLHHWEQP